MRKNVIDIQNKRIDTIDMLWIVLKWVVNTLPG
jgi:hypothetical protein